MDAWVLRRHSASKIIVWQKSHALTLRVYRVTSSFPRHEVYGLTSQMRRAAVSVSANIAEGFAKRGRTDKARFFNTAQGSLQELRYYFVLARDLEYATEAVDSSDIDHVARLLSAYIRALRLVSPTS